MKTLSAREPRTAKRSKAIFTLNGSIHEPKEPIAMSQLLRERPLRLRVDVPIRLAAYLYGHFQHVLSLFNSDCFRSIAMADAGGHDHRLIIISDTADRLKCCP